MLQPAGNLQGKVGNVLHEDQALGVDVVVTNGAQGMRQWQTHTRSIGTECIFAVLTEAAVLGAQERRRKLEGGGRKGGIVVRRRFHQKWVGGGHAGMGFQSARTGSGPDDLRYMVETQYSLLAVLEKVLQTAVDCVFQNQVGRPPC